MRYRILHGKTIQELEATVNEHTLNEWELYGVLMQGADGTFHQCVTKRVPKSGRPVDFIEGDIRGAYIEAVGAAGALDFVRNR